MSAVQRYHEFMQTRASRLEMLEEEQVKLKRQLQYFNDAKERYELLESAIDVDSCQKGINALKEKLAQNEQAMEDLNIAPYAEEAMTEFVEQRNALQDEFEKQWQKALTARDFYLNELKALSDIRRRSINLSYDSKPVAITLRQQHLDELHYGSNRFDFNIDITKVL